MKAESPRRKESGVAGVQEANAYGREKILASNRLLADSTHLGSAHEQALHLHGAVVEAIRLRRPDAARAAIMRILQAAVADLRARHGGSLD